MELIQLITIVIACTSLVVLVAHSIIQSNKIQRRINVDHVCPNCHYIRRGWAGTVCPECGTDTRDIKKSITLWSTKPIAFFLAATIAAITVHYLGEPIENRYYVIECRRERVFTKRIYQNMGSRIYTTTPVSGYEKVSVDFVGIFDTDLKILKGNGTLTLHGSNGKQTLIFDEPNIPSTQSILEAMTNISNAAIDDIPSELAEDLIGLIEWLYAGNMYFIDANGIRGETDERTLSVDQYNGYSGSSSTLHHTTLFGASILIASYLATFVLLFVLFTRIKYFSIPVKQAIVKA